MSPNATREHFPPMAMQVVLRSQNILPQPFLGVSIASSRRNELLRLGDAGLHRCVKLAFPKKNLFRHQIFSIPWFLADGVQGLGYSSVQCRDASCRDYKSPIGET